MSLIGIVHLAGKLLDQTQENGQTQPSRSRSGGNAQAARNSDGDQFTPSAKNPGQDAGIFQVSNVSVFSAAVDFVLSKPNAPQAAPHGLHPTPSQTPDRTDAQDSASANGAAQVPSSNVATGAPKSSAASAQGNAAASAVTPAASQQQLQSLNAKLAALGLSQAEISVIDRVARLIRDFNPQAFTALVNQLQALAPHSKQQASAPVSAQAATQGAGPNATQAAAQPANGSNATNSGFSIQELSIKFSGAQGTVAQAKGEGESQRAGQFSAVNLQIEEVRLTLGNNAGQTTQIQAPQAAPASSPSPAKA